MTAPARSAAPASDLYRGQLATRALGRLVAGIAGLTALLIGTAGTFDYWEAWLYMAVLFVPVTLMFCYLLAYQPDLLERRLRTREKAGAQARMVKLGSLCYVLAFALPGLDRRFGWSDVPTGAVIVADGLFLIGYALFVTVLRVNHYASRVIEVEAGQRVVTTGPYSIVRHPMYSAILVMFLATPVALGSWWAAVPALALVAVLVARIRDEERLLSTELEGYEQYRHVTRYKLLPGIW